MHFDQGSDFAVFRDEIDGRVATADIRPPQSLHVMSALRSFPNLGERRGRSQRLADVHSDLDFPGPAQDRVTVVAVRRRFSLFL
jgi:hypothetical protein